MRTKKKIENNRKQINNQPIDQPTNDDVHAVMSTPTNTNTNTTNTTKTTDIEVARLTHIGGEESEGGTIVGGEQGTESSRMSMMREASWLLRPDVEAWNRWFGAGGDSTPMDLYATLASHSTLSHIRFGLFDRAWGFGWFRRLAVAAHRRERGGPDAADDHDEGGEEVRVPFEVKNWAKNEVVLGRMAEAPGSAALQEKNICSYQFLMAATWHDAGIALRKLLRLSGIGPERWHQRRIDEEKDEASGTATIPPFLVSAGSSPDTQRTLGTKTGAHFQLLVDDDAYAFLERWARDEFPQSSPRDWCDFAAFALSHCQVYQNLQLHDEHDVADAEARWDHLRKNNEHWRRAGSAPNSFVRNLQAETSRRREQSPGVHATRRGDARGDSGGGDEGKTDAAIVRYSDFDSDPTAGSPHNLLPGITSNFQGGFFQPGLNGAALGFHFTLDNVEVPIATTSALHRDIRDATESWPDGGHIPPHPPPKLPDCASTTVLYEFDPTELRNLPALWDFRRRRPRFGGSVDALRAFLAKQRRRADASELERGDERWARDLHTLSLPATGGDGDDGAAEEVLLTDFNLVGLFGDLRVFAVDDDDDGDGGPPARRQLFSKRDAHVTLWANYLRPDGGFWSEENGDGAATLDFLLNELSERVEGAKPLFGEPCDVDGVGVGGMRAAPVPEVVDCGALFASLVDAAPSPLPPRGGS